MGRGYGVHTGMEGVVSMKIKDLPEDVSLGGVHFR